MPKFRFQLNVDVEVDVAGRAAWGHPGEVVAAFKDYVERLLEEADKRGERAVFNPDFATDNEVYFSKFLLDDHPHDVYVG
jgi:hypothetical protein